MNYQEARAYVSEINALSGSILGLERIERLMAWLGNPQEQLKIVHVAGTNGKGSFGAVLASIVMAAGYSCGRFVSPAIYDPREVVQINGEWISEADAAEMLTRIRTVCDMHCRQPEDYPTSFEIETAMAFLYFEKMQPDLVILEVGLGGENDSTNVITCPLLSVITSISYDHKAMLGDTLEAIAAQKAGIIKAGSTVLVYDQTAAVTGVLKAVADARGADYVQSDFSTIKVHDVDLGGQTFDYGPFENLCLGLLGDYQAYNAALAVDAAVLLNQLAPSQFAIGEQHIRDGLKQARWEGRFEKVADQPLIIVDGAHNPDGARQLARSIRTYLYDYSILFVAGIFRDKEYNLILREVAQLSDVIYTHTPPGPRGLEAEQLAECAGQYFANVTSCMSISEALSQATAQAKALGTAKKPVAIVSFGSLSTICELKNWLRNQFSVI